MTGLPKTIILVTTITILLQFAHAVEVEIYKYTNFKGLIYEHSSKSSECINLPEYAQGMAGSVVTDTCLMLYESSGCSGFSFKLSRDMTEELRDLRRTVNSFQACNENYGGETIHVDMLDADRELIGEYFDICGCQDLPTQITTKLHSLNNYGNCLTVYSTSTCSGSHDDITAGRNGLSDRLPDLGYNIHSISACAGRSTCVRLDSSIFKFEMNMEAPPDEKEEQVKLGQTTRFFNNGSATVTQEYEAKRTIKETTVVKKASSFKQFRGYKTAKTFSVGVNVGASIPIPDTTLVVDIGLSVGYASSKAYGEGQSEEESQSEEYTNIEEKEFTSKQTFEVPPCVEYEVNSALKMVEDYPVEYDVYSLVTGEASGRKLTAEEVAGRVDSMTFVGYHDEYTAIFMTSGSITANVGYETVVYGEGNPIPGCKTQ